MTAAGRVPGSRRTAAAARRLSVGALALVGLCLYVAWSLQVLDVRVARQVEVTGHPFVISDLFPRWLGSRALLAGENPYSAEFNAELHRHYYGRVMAPEVEAALLGSVMEFFYPPYVALTLLPLLWLPFELVRWLSTAGLAAGLAAAAWLWLRLLGARSRPVLLGGAVGAVVFFPSLDVITLQQLTGLVLIELIGAYALAAHRRYVSAGILLGLSLIKPQGAVLAVGALAFWALWRRDRWPLIGALAATAAVQLAFGFAVAPDWVPEFLAAAARYGRFNTEAYWLPGKVAGNAILGAVLIALPVGGGIGAFWWRHRHDDLSGGPLVSAMALTLAATNLLMPDISYYNKAFLLPAIATVLADHRFATTRLRVTWRLVVLSVFASPIMLASVALVTLVWHSHELPKVWAVAAFVNGYGLALYELLPLIIMAASLTRFLPRGVPRTAVPAVEWPCRAAADGARCHASPHQASDAPAWNR